MKYGRNKEEVLSVRCKTLKGHVLFQANASHERMKDCFYGGIFSSKFSFGHTSYFTVTAL